ncbi:MAG: DUF4384 domain-containing protein [Deinococcales bacterium]
MLLMTAQAQPLSAQSIVIQPNPGSGNLWVEVFVDKDPSGSSLPSYTLGESIRIGVRSSENGYIYLFNVRSNGHVIQILPNSYDSNTYHYANQVRYYPDSSDRYRFSIDAPLGRDAVIAVFARQPLSSQALSQIRGQVGSFQTSAIVPLSIVVEPIPQQIYASDVAYFYVTGNYPSQPPYTPPLPPRYNPVPPAPYPSVGSLYIQSNPYVNVYVDGSYRGQTSANGQFNLNDLYVGSHNIMLEYRNPNGVYTVSYSQTVSIGGGQPFYLNYYF